MIPVIYDPSGSGIQIPGSEHITAAKRSLLRNSMTDQLSPSFASAWPTSAVLHLVPKVLAPHPFSSAAFLRRKVKYVWLVNLFSPENL